MRKVLTTILLAYIAAVVAVGTAVICPAAPKDKVIRLAAKKFEYSPAEITVKKGEAVVIELSSQDVTHGFTLPDFRIRTDIKPGSVNRISFVPDKTGRFAFNCDVFCGAGHEDMSGTLIVTE
jgi:cytochrome c oxidase subunit 2